MYSFLVIFVAIIIIQLFLLQIINYNTYKNAALKSQLKQYQIPAERGLIYIEGGNGSQVPIVLDQKLYTLYADPSFIKSNAAANKIAKKIAPIFNANPGQLTSLMETKNTRYIVLGNKLSQAQSQKILSYQIPGIGTQGQDYRVYPEGQLAAQVLGFVNQNGVGEYGIEQAMNKQLAGTPGQVKAVTDASGVPLAANSKNVEIAPKNGDSLVLTLNLGMQSQLEKILAKEYTATKSQGLSAIVMNPYNGHIKAMANFPTFNPANYQDVSNQKIFQNAAVDDDIEPGSTMKIMTTAAALNLGVIKPNTSFYDPAQWTIDGFTIHDIKIDGGAREQNIQSILALSLNTGATWMLMQMGGGQIDRQGINNWYEYMVNHYRLGQVTGIEQGYEAPGFVPPPNMADPSIDLRYANTSFGQGVQLTALQMAAADSSILNGGTYYKPTLIAKTIYPNGQTKVNPPKVLERNVVKPVVGQEMVPLMEGVVKAYLYGGFSFMNFPSNYIVGGKTGTAQLAQPGGGYYKNIFNGTYAGFVGGKNVQYVVVVYNIKPAVPGYAGSYGAQPVFADIVHMLINQGYVTPR
jgi:cell division protein FtsI/penicillin-binding protein 2